jgi:hypothetical protein
MITIRKIWNNRTIMKINNNTNKIIIALMIVIGRTIWNNGVILKINNILYNLILINKMVLYHNYNKY